MTGVTFPTIQNTLGICEQITLLFHYQVTYRMANFLNSFMPQQVSIIIYYQHHHHHHHHHYHLYAGYLQLHT